MKCHIGIVLSHEEKDDSGEPPQRVGQDRTGLLVQAGGLRLVRGKLRRCHAASTCHTRHLPIPTFSTKRRRVIQNTGRPNRNLTTCSPRSNLSGQVCALPIGGFDSGQGGPEERRVGKECAST